MEIEKPVFWGLNYVGMCVVLRHSLILYIFPKEAFYIDFQFANEKFTPISASIAPIHSKIIDKCVVIASLGGMFIGLIIFVVYAI
ncbi:MAG: hypothetical protein LBQ66_14150 [Planctomycetaceae bacterium]|nr:hypothetical protein [Planctomycetaceae bacterium]